MNELFGQGTASYVEVRDQFSGDEFLAWLAFLDRWDEEKAARDKAKEHEQVMAAALRAVRG